MKKSQVKPFIRESIIDILSEETVIATNSGTDTDATFDQKNTAKKALDKGDSVKFTKKGQPIKEEDIDEMARTASNIIVGDPEKFEKAKKIYGDSWGGKLLDLVKDAGEKGISQNELVTALGKKSFAEINPFVKDFVSVGALSKFKSPEVLSTEEEPETIDEPTSAEEPSSSEEVKPESEFFIQGDEDEAPVEKEEEPKEEEPSQIDIKAGEKVSGGKMHAKELSPEDEEKYHRIKKGIEAKVTKLKDMTKAKRSESTDLKLLKQLIKRDDVKKLFKAKGVSLKDIVAGVIS